jgi:hypothetical protein
LNWVTQSAQGQRYATAARQTSSGGGSFRQAPHWWTFAGTGKAQVAHRGTGCAKRATHALHTTCEGQA